MKSAEQMLNHATTAVAVVAGVAIVAMLLMVMLDVILKYTLNQPVHGTLELVSFYFMPLAIFCAFPVVQKQDGHIAVTLFTDLLPSPMRDRLSVIVSFLCAGYLGLFAWAGMERAAHLTQSGQSTSAIYYDIPIWPARWSLPVTIGLMAAWLTVQGVSRLASFRRLGS